MGRRAKGIWGWLSLVLVAVLAAGLWRVEVEYHGWDGLIWIGYYHWAVPASAGLFLVWAGVFCGVRPAWKRAALLSSIAGFAVAAWFASRWALVQWFGGAPFFMYWRLPWTHFEPAIPWGGGQVYLGPWALPVIYPAIPLFACLIARAFGRCRTWRHWLLANALFLGAYPAAVLALKITEHVGHDDAPIHTIKSGLIVPLLVIGLGVPFLPLGGAGRAVWASVGRKGTDERG